MSEELTALIALLESGTVYVFWITLLYVMKGVILAIIWVPALVYTITKIIRALEAPTDG